MTNSVDPDQLASEEANWSGSTLFAKAGHIWVQQDYGWMYRRKVCPAQTLRHAASCNFIKLLCCLSIASALNFENSNAFWFSLRLFIAKTQAYYCTFILAKLFFFIPTYLGLLLWGLYLCRTMLGNICSDYVYPGLGVPCTVHLKNLGFIAVLTMPSKHSDQTAWMCRLIWIVTEGMCP